MKSLFDKNISRLDVLAYKNSYKNDSKKQNIKIMIFRNHSFEMVSSVLNPFLNYFDFSAEFEFSSYDDSLTFSFNENKADLNILWLDLERYNPNEIESFLNEKISELYEKTKKPIILGYTGNIKDYQNSSAYIININDIVKDLGVLAFDYNKEKYSGTKLSAKASVKIAQYLGLKIIPSFFMPQIKAIITDLDNTFYKGIIGEDGIENITSNLLYQKKLQELSYQGYMLGIASKNDECDIKKLFFKKDDFKLKYDDFTCTKINWEAKSNNIIDMAKNMNIAPDSILFIDDNIAEIEEVKSKIPDIKTILFENEEKTVDILNLHPAFLKTSITKEDLLRSKDIQANQKRNKLIKTLSKEEYFKKLDIKIELFLNDKSNIDRITELLNKTNQFILSYRRYNKTEIENILNSKEFCIITAKMKDKLSDSGIIAILICKKTDNNLFVDELTFSCRALGRNIEDIVISKMLLISKEYLKTSNNILINYKKGQRNTPALLWLQAFCDKELKNEGVINYSLKGEIQTHGLDIREIICAQNF